jgi:hypothetical protein
MSNFFQDRFRGASSPGVVEEGAIVGRWIISRIKEEPVSLNSIRASDGDFLTPDSSGNWSILVDGASPRAGSFRDSQLIAEHDKKSILAIGSLLQSIMDEGGGWLEWLGVSPIVPQIDDKLELQPLEEEVEKLFGHLEEVCSKPRTHLLEEVERVPIHKARRLPTKAISYLASHTEDWESRQLIRGVVPKRILSEVRDDQVDIYENRVAARLVDNLSSYLTDRIRLLKKVFKMKKHTVLGWHLLQTRIFRLWGEAVKTDEKLVWAKEILQKLEALNYKLKGLMDSELYKKVPKMAGVEPVLKMTNILANDQHYRRVAELWQAWSRACLTEAPSPKKIHLEAQMTCRGMDYFLMLLVLRAFDQLGYAPEELEVPISKQGQWHLEKNGSHCSCLWDETGIVEIETNDEKIFMVAVPMDFAQAENDEQVREIIEQLVECSKSRNGNLLVAYCSSNSPNKELSTDLLRELNTLGNDTRSQLPSSVGMVPVSPWDLLSLERITRSLKWFLEKQSFDNYPREISVSKKQLDLLDSKSIPRGITLSPDKRKFVLERLPPEYEREQWGLNKKQETAEEACKFAQNELKRLERARKTSHKALALQKNKVLEHQDRKEQVTKLVKDLEEAYEWTHALLTCPACSASADPFSLTPRTNGFHCSCEDCNTIWESRTCGGCHVNFPIILPGGKHLETEFVSIGSEEKIYGSDLLALPAKDSKGKLGFLCPKCGHVG